MSGRARLLLASLAVAACSRKPVLVTSEDGPPPAPLEGLPVTFAPVPAAPALPGSGPFYEPDRMGKAVLMRRFDGPNILYAGLGREACEAELVRRAIPVEHAPETPDVVTPVWLRGPLHGVTIRSQLAPKVRLRSPFEIFDCRLLLAVDDFAALLAEHDVAEVIHLSAHRPRASNGCLPNAAATQHCGGLALDVGSFRKKDGAVLEIDRDFHGKVGGSTCAGISKPKPPSPAATELWTIVCDAAARALFHVILTPNTNREHKNHLHLEVTPNAAWMLVH